MSGSLASAANVGDRTRVDGHPETAPSNGARTKSGEESGVVGRFGVSASVGHDHWANDVLRAVEPNLRPSPDPAESSDEAGEPATITGVEEKVRLKKKKFHAGRALELKNLPDDCTEQVGICQVHIFFEK